jgi:hypothetical protein
MCPVEGCVGLDAHPDTLPACLRLLGAGGLAGGRFGRMNGELSELRDWIDSAGVIVGGHGSDGVYWKPGARARGRGRPPASMTRRTMTGLRTAWCGRGSVCSSRAEHREPPWVDRGCSAPRERGCFGGHIV